MRKWLLLSLSLVSIAGARAVAIYDVPNNDGDCPANCRRIAWRAGSDLWNGGTLPTYTGVTCAGLTEGSGTSDNTTRITNCLTALSSQQASIVPPGIYYVNGTISIPSNKVLRGSGSANCVQGRWLSNVFRGDTGGGARCTTLNFGPDGGVRFSGGASFGGTVNLSSGYTKGSQSIVASSSPGVTVNQWIIVSENQGDTAIPTSATGDKGEPCTWCGDNGTGYLMSQIVQVTSVAGNTIGISRPLYYTFKSALTPRIRSFSTIGSTKAGLEGIKLDGYVNRTTRTDPHIYIDGCMRCWVRDAETFDTPDVAKAYPIYIEYSYGTEVRDSYFHFGQSNQSDRNYGIGIFGPNSDLKIENNIYRENRHSTSQEGGGSGNVFLYNYIDDNWTNDLSFLASARTNHGAHPYMTLWEGNIISHLQADNIWGSSSHQVLFRNWLWGDETGNFAGYDSTHPDWGFVALDISTQQHYYAAVGNVLGHPNLHTTWSNANLFRADCSWHPTRSQPTVYGLGCLSGYSGQYDGQVRSTTILHGNYDYKTLGVAFWDGGSDHTLRESMYYASKPAFFGSCDWPVFGPDLNPVTRMLPAKARYDGSACAGLAPAAPTSLRIVP
jgi:hypothetical protein